MKNRRSMPKTVDEQERLMELSKQRLRNDGCSFTTPERICAGDPSEDAKSTFRRRNGGSGYYAFKLVCEASKIKVVTVDKLTKERKILTRTFLRGYPRLTAEKSS
jgi:hypothetical protein